MLSVISQSVCCLLLKTFPSRTNSACISIRNPWKTKLAFIITFREIMTRNERKIAGVSRSAPLLLFPSVARIQISVKTESAPSFRRNLCTKMKMLSNYSFFILFVCSGAVAKSRFKNPSEFLAIRDALHYSRFYFYVLSSSSWWRALEDHSLCSSKNG